MSVLTLTEAITELAFGERMDVDRLAEARFAEANEWRERHRSLSIAADRAAQVAGQELSSFKVTENLLLPPLPQEVVDLFAASKKRQREERVTEVAIARAVREIIEAAIAGKIEVWGSFDGTGRSEEIPSAELRHLTLKPDEFERDALLNRQTSRSWSAVTIPTASFASWREADAEQADIALAPTTDRKLIRQCMRLAYKAAKEQAVSPPNKREIVAPVNKLLGRSRKSATATLIREVAGEPEFAKQRPAQGTPRPKDLKPASDLEI